MVHIFPLRLFKASLFQLSHAQLCVLMQFILEEPEIKAVLINRNL